MRKKTISLNILFDLIDKHIEIEEDYVKRTCDDYNYGRLTAFKDLKKELSE